MFGNIPHKIRLLFRKDRESYLVFYNIMGFYPNDLRYYQIALLHKSNSMHSRKGKPINNERLEYLGDAVLEAVVSDILFDHFKNKGEGFLSSTRSKIVQRETLNQVAVQIGLDKLVKYTTHSQTHNNYMYGNAFEAFVGAIYLDKGYDYCRRFMTKKIFKDFIDMDQLSRKEINFKSKLIEWSQKNRLLTTFELIEQSVDENFSPTFHSQVLVEGLFAGEGVGYSKKESQQRAAQAALKRIRTDRLFARQIQSIQEERMMEEGRHVQNDARPTDDSRYLEE